MDLNLYITYDQKKWRWTKIWRQPQKDDIRNVDNLNNEGGFRNEDNIRNGDNLKNEDDLRNEDNLKNEDDLKKGNRPQEWMKTTSKMKMKQA